MKTPGPAWIAYFIAIQYQEPAPRYGYLGSARNQAACAQPPAPRSPGPPAQVPRAVRPGRSGDRVRGEHLWVSLHPHRGVCHEGVPAAAPPREAHCPGKPLDRHHLEHPQLGAHGAALALEFDGYYVRVAPASRALALQPAHARKTHTIRGLSRSRILAQKAPRETVLGTSPRPGGIAAVAGQTNLVHSGRQTT